MEISIITVLLFIPGIFIFLWILLSIVGRIRPFPVPFFMGKYLDSNYRRFIQPPDKLIKRSGIKEGMCVLEIGCGSGAFTNYVARALGNGYVFALDIQPEMLDQLKKKLMKFENRDVSNVFLINSDACKMPFKNDYFDLVFMVATLQEIKYTKKALKEIKRVLKPHGILAITEFIPDPDYPLKSTTIKQCENAGFLFDRVEGSFINYTTRFIKPEFDFEKLG
ncbi:class I SAM-dependent methyltransferase [Methanobacterium sp. ACI-7]|uniref:class I SAM-dependent methyltransferase n=1 Tax=unclassified Methanobacterium TaxID=2627676 RepID=UPI0039C0374F